MRIITLTLNPAYDVHCEISNFALEKENMIESYLRTVGGKGINITRALLKHGIETTPILILGNENSKDFESDLASEGITNSMIIRVSGRIRENFTIHPKCGKETRMCFKGFTVEAGTLNKVYDLISPKSGDMVAFSGSLPIGISSLEAEDFLTKLKAAGVKLIIDSKSISLEAIRRIKPWLIKPNDEEIVDYFGELDHDGIVDAAASLHRDGIENVVVSLGGDGAILACAEGVFEGVPPKIKVLSTIGAGDSLVSGYIAAADKPYEERLRLGIAYGSAACLLEGTNPPLPEDIQRIYGEVSIKKIR